MTPPDFSCSISVSQHGNGSGGFSLILLCTMLCMAVVAIPGMALIDGVSGVLYGAGLLAVTVAAMFAMLLGFVAAMWMEGLWRKWRGLAPLFSETTQVDINAGGLSVKGLGMIVWRDVLAIEGIPDSESALIVHTRPFEKLMLQAPTEELAAVISHYMEQQALEGDSPQARWKAAGILHCRAVVFHWPLFMSWIWAGYLLAGATAATLLMLKPDAGLFKHLVVLCVLMPMIAWLIWAIPFSQLGLFASGRVRALELEGTHLRSTGGTPEYNLSEARVTHRHSKGIGFELEFISVRPYNGSGIDILIQGDEERALLEAITERGLNGRP